MPAFVALVGRPGIPGSLTPEEYGQVTAHLPRLMGMPAGAETLNPDPAALSEIRIDSIPSKPR